jgi:hypothetical protein
MTQDSVSPSPNELRCPARLTQIQSAPAGRQAKRRVFLTFSQIEIPNLKKGIAVPRKQRSPGVLAKNAAIFIVNCMLSEAGDEPAAAWGPVPFRWH